MTTADTPNRDDNLNAVAKLTVALVDVLIPGDDLFPAASAVGSHGLLLDRLRQVHGAAIIDEVVSAVGKATRGQDFTTLGENDRIAAVRAFEQAEPDLFATVRAVLYYSYYQSPLVIRAVQALGHDYNEAPQPRGYPMRPFDPTPGADAPATPRGTYKRTDEISRIDLSTLPDAEAYPAEGS